VNLALYHYAGNNPVKYTDPDGNEIIETTDGTHQQDSSSGLGSGKTTIAKEGCVLTTFLRIANTISGKNYTLDDANSKAKSLGLFEGKDKDELSAASGAKLIGALTGSKISFGVYEGNEKDLIDKVRSLDDDPYEGFFVTGRIQAHDSTGTKQYGHQVNINEKGSATQPIFDTSTKDRKTTQGDKNGSEPIYRVYWFKLESYAPDK